MDKTVKEYLYARDKRLLISINASLESLKSKIGYVLHIKSWCSELRRELSILFGKKFSKEIEQDWGIFLSRQMKLWEK